MWTKRATLLGALGCMLLISLPHFNMSVPLKIKDGNQISLEVATKILEDALKRGGYQESNGGYKNVGRLMKEGPKRSSYELENILDAAIKEIEDEYQIENNPGESNLGKNSEENTFYSDPLVIPSKNNLPQRFNKNKPESHKLRSVKAGPRKPANQRFMDHSNADSVADVRDNLLSDTELQLLGLHNAAGPAKADFPPYQAKNEMPDFVIGNSQSDGRNDSPYPSKILQAIKNLFHDPAYGSERHPTMELIGEGIKQVMRNTDSRHEEHYKGSIFTSNAPKFNDFYQDLQQSDGMGRDIMDINSILPLVESENWNDQRPARRAQPVEKPMGWHQRSIAYQKGGNWDSKKVADEFEELAAALEDDIYGKHEQKPQTGQGLIGNNDNEHTQFKPLNSVRKGNKGRKLHLLDDAVKETTSHKERLGLKGMKGSGRYPSIPQSDTSRNSMHSEAHASISPNKSDAASPFEDIERQPSLMKEETSSNKGPSSFTANEKREANMIDEIEARVTELQQEIAEKRQPKNGNGSRKRLRM